MPEMIVFLEGGRWLVVCEGEEIELATLTDLILFLLRYWDERQRKLKEDGWDDAEY